MSREDQFSVSVVVDGRSLGIFDRKEGGEVDSEELKYRPGGMAPQQSLGGFQNVGNVTVSRLFDLSRDLPNVPFLSHRAGKSDMTIVVQHLDLDGNPFGKPYTYAGTFKQYTLPDHNSDSSDAAMVSLEMSSARLIAI